MHYLPLVAEGADLVFQWYMKKGDYRRAYESLLRLRNNPIQSARDLYYIHSQYVTWSKLAQHLVEDYIGRCLLFLHWISRAAGFWLDTDNLRLELERQIIGSNTYMKRFIELFTVPRLRRASLGAFTVMMAQQLCGINVIAFYSTTIFVEAGASETSALYGFPWRLLL